VDLSRRDSPEADPDVLLWRGSGGLCSRSRQPGIMIPLHKLCEPVKPDYNYKISGSPIGQISGEKTMTAQNFSASSEMKTQCIFASYLYNPERCQELN
jgi:hypothetical protein